MGSVSDSTWTTKEKVVTSLKQDMERSGWIVTDTASTRSGVYFCVTTSTDSFIYFALITKHKNEFWVKTMTESMGPAEVDCPIRMLNHPCTTGSYSAQWRESVRQYHSQKKSKPTAPNLIGKKISLYKKEYNVIGLKKRSYLVEEVSTLKRFRLGPQMAKDATIIGAI